MTRSCGTCGADLSGTHGKRKFCSERCRKAQYNLVCVVCRGRVDGTTPGKIPDRDHPVCYVCAPAYYAKWNRENVVAAIQRFAERYGRPPCATDFNPSFARRLGHDWRAERFRTDGDYPVTASVMAVCGSWNAAIEAAGFSPRGVGEYPRLLIPGEHFRGAHLEREAA